MFTVTAISMTCLYSYGYISRTVLLVGLILWAVPVLCAWQLMDSMTLLNSVLYRNNEVVEQPIRLAGLSQRFVKEGIEFMGNATSRKEPFLLVMSWCHMHTFLTTAKEFAGKSQFGRYGDALEELDWSVGELLKYIDSTGGRNNTLVYFTSDNGGHLELGTDGGWNGILRGKVTSFNTLKCIFVYSSVKVSCLSSFHYIEFVVVSSEGIKRVDCISGKPR